MDLPRLVFVKKSPGVEPEKTGRCLVMKHPQAQTFLVSFCPLKAGL